MARKPKSTTSCNICFSKAGSQQPAMEGGSCCASPPAARQPGCCNLRSEAAAQLLCRRPPVQLGCTRNTGFSGPCYSLSIAMGWKAPIIHHPNWILSFHVSVPFPWTSHEPHLHGEMTSTNSAPLTKDQHFLLLEKRYTRFFNLDQQLFVL